MKNHRQARQRYTQFMFVHKMTLIHLKRGICVHSGQVAGIWACSGHQTALLAVQTTRLRACPLRRCGQAPFKHRSAKHNVCFLQVKNKQTQPSLKAFWAKRDSVPFDPAVDAALRAKRAEEEASRRAVDERRTKAIIFLNTKLDIRDGSVGAPKKYTAKRKEARSCLLQVPSCLYFIPHVYLAYYFFSCIRYSFDSGLCVEELDDWWASAGFLALEAMPPALRPFSLPNQRATAKLHESNAWHVLEDDETSPSCHNAAYLYAQPVGKLILRSLMHKWDSRGGHAGFYEPHWQAYLDNVSKLIGASFSLRTAQRHLST